MITTRLQSLDAIQHIFNQVTLKCYLAGPGNTFSALNWTEQVSNKPMQHLLHLHDRFLFNQIHRPG
jgi:hypothetical protein